MDLKDLGELIAKDAPLLGSIVGTVNPAAGLLINAVSNLFGANPSSPDDIAEKISLDSNASSRLKELELQHQEVLKQNLIDDRKSARNREESIIKITGKRDSILDLIAFSVIVGYFFFCYLILFVKFDQSTYHVVWMVAGQFSTALMMVLSYYFGASNK